MLPDKEKINEVIKRSADYSVTKNLIDEFKYLKKDRDDFYLKKDELEKILRWKLRDQYGRQNRIRENNTDQIISKITKTAFSINHPKTDIETEFKINILTTLKGVGIPVASSILTLCYPEQFGVIDFRNWRWLFKERKNYYTLNDYNRYLKEIRKIAEQKDMTPQEIDFYIWESDRMSSN